MTSLDIIARKLIIFSRRVMTMKLPADVEESESPQRRVPSVHEALIYTFAKNVEVN
jgi:hypothetical protein